MSESTIARWNAIPLARQDPEPSTSLKRPRGEDDEDDDISIASRTPSPPPPDAMDVDKYDEYVRRPVREIITVDTKISSDNKGFGLLMKMGWSEGQPLGLSDDGLVDPIPFRLKVDSTGIGKAAQDVEMIETTVSQRREMDSERQQKETEEQRKLREESVARKVAVETEISMTLKSFYCSLCDKQFKNVAQYDEHTNSYAHHHKARLKDMQANARLVPKDELDKRREKERRREEKELRKIAAANGIKMPKSVSQPPSSNLTPVATPSVAPVSEEPKREGWGITSSVPHGGFKKSGWATVGTSGSPAANSSHQATSSITQTPAAASEPTSIPGFRNAGWTSLDLGGVHPPPAYEAPPPPAPSSSSNRQPAALSQTTASQATTTAQPVRTGWQQFNSSMKGRGRR